MSLVVSMQSTPTVAEFAKAVHSFLDDLDPSRTFGEASLAAARDALSALDASAARLQDAWDGVPPVSSAEARLRQAVLSLHTALPEPGSLSDALPEWFDLRERLSPLYEHMAVALVADANTEVEHLRPTNYARNLLHVSCGLLSILAFEHLLTTPMVRLAALGMLVWAWGMEISRVLSPQVNAFLMTVFSRVSHPHEAVRINSATWYTSAVFLICLASPDRNGVLGLLVLSVGDPMAALIGRRFGRIKIGSKSLEGFAAFVLTSALASAAYLGGYYPELAPLPLVGLAVGASVAGGLAELFTSKLDDNMTIPLAATAGAVLMAAVL